MTMLDSIHEMEAEKIAFSDINMIVLDNMPEKESDRQVYMISLSRAAKHFYGVNYLSIYFVFKCLYLWGWWGSMGSNVETCT